MRYIFQSKRNTAILATVTMIIVAIYAVLYQDTTHPLKADVVDITFKDFQQELAKDTIDLMYFTTTSKYMYAELDTGVLLKTTNPEYEDFKSELLAHDIILKEISELEFAEDVKTNHAISAVLIGFVICLGYLIAYSCYNSKEAATTGIGEVKPDSPKTQTVTKKFSDVAGLTEVKKDMETLVDFLVNKSKYLEAGASLPRGVLLYGPPGTGKTLLAKAVAGEAGVSFLYMSGSEFIEMYVGVGAKRVRDLFDKARKKAPCIVFIDEIDAIGSKRTGQENSEDRKTINALLTEMDGFKESDNIIVIGATNRVDDLDSALLRPGRFTDKFCVPLPETVSERKQIFKIYMANKNFSDDVILDDLAHETVGFSPAQIEALLNEAAILSVRKGLPYIDKATIEESMSKMVLRGHIRENQSERNEAELQLVAQHEAGHALAGVLLGDTVTKVSILSTTSGAGGVTFSVPSKQNLLTLDDLKNRVKVLYGGRAAEELFTGTVSTGASNDIEKATELIHQIVVKFGMVDDIGPLNVEQMSHVGNNKEYIIKREIDLAKQLYCETYDLLYKHFDKLKELADSLLKNETIYKAELDELFKEP